LDTARIDGALTRATTRLEFLVARRAKLVDCEPRADAFHDVSSSSERFVLDNVARQGRRK
jgi:hypothetical protein